MPLTAALRNRLRATTSRFLIDTATIEVQVAGTGSYGEPLNSWQLVATSVACRVITLGQNRNAEAATIVGSQETLTDLYRIICPAGTALAMNQRITVNGIVYQVIGLETALTDEVFRAATITRQR